MKILKKLRNILSIIYYILFNAFCFALYLWIMIFLIFAVFTVFYLFDLYNYLYRPIPIFINIFLIIIFLFYFSKFRQWILSFLNIIKTKIHENSLIKCIVKSNTVAVLPSNIINILKLPKVIIIMIIGSLCLILPTINLFLDLPMPENLLIFLKLYGNIHTVFIIFPILIIRIIYGINTLIFKRELFKFNNLYLNKVYTLVAINFYSLKILLALISSISILFKLAYSLNLIENSLLSYLIIYFSIEISIISSKFLLFEKFKHLFKLWNHDKDFVKMNFMHSNPNSELVIVKKPSDSNLTHSPIFSDDYTFERCRELIEISKRLEGQQGPSSSLISVKYLPSPFNVEKEFEAQRWRDFSKELLKKKKFSFPVFLDVYTENKLSYETRVSNTETIDIGVDLGASVTTGYSEDPNISKSEMWIESNTKKLKNETIRFYFFSDSLFLEKLFEFNWIMLNLKLKTETGFMELIPDQEQQEVLETLACSLSPKKREILKKYLEDNLPHKDLNKNNFYIVESLCELFENPKFNYIEKSEDQLDSIKIGLDIKTNSGYVFQRENSNLNNSKGKQTRGIISSFKPNFFEFLGWGEGGLFRQIKKTSSINFNVSELPTSTPNFLRRGSIPNNSMKIITIPGDWDQVNANSGNPELGDRKTSIFKRRGSVPINLFSKGVAQDSVGSLEILPESSSRRKSVPHKSEPEQIILDNSLGTE